MVYHNKKNKPILVPLKYIPYINFNVKDFANARNRSLTPGDIFPNLKKTFYAYETIFFDSDDINPDQPIYFLDDTNNNHKVDNADKK
ncbi:UNVERIFIED_CONTAM: hypothetical protein O8I53_12100 [Campylobacter lari]